MVISVGNKKQKKKGGGGFRVFAADLTIDLTFSHRWAEFGLKCASRLERVHTVCCVGPMSAKKKFPGPWGSFPFAGIIRFSLLSILYARMGRFPLATGGLTPSLQFILGSFYSTQDARNITYFHFATYSGGLDQA